MTAPITARRIGRSVARCPSLSTSSIELTHLRMVIVPSVPSSVGSANAF